MRIHRIFPLYFFAVLMSIAASGQPTVLDFDLERNKIILPVSVNGSDTQKVILDSGMPFDGFYFFHREMMDHFQSDRLEEWQVGGAGNGNASTVLRFDNVDVFIGSQLFTGKSVLISQSETTQDFPTDGITGRSIFRYNYVLIDYDRGKLFISDNEMPLDSSWSEIPFKLNRSNIPYLDVSVQMNDADTAVKLLVYIDLAASEAIEILVGDERAISSSEGKTEVLGSGLSGDITGKKGRIASLAIGDFKLHDLEANFPDASSRSRQEDMFDGIIGCGLLKHFNIMFDFENKILYYKPSRLFNEREGVK